MPGWFLHPQYLTNSSVTLIKMRHNSCISLRNNYKMWRANFQDIKKFLWVFIVLQNPKQWLLVVSLCWCVILILQNFRFLPSFPYSSFPLSLCLCLLLSLSRWGIQSGYRVPVATYLSLCSFLWAIPTFWDHLYYYSTQQERVIITRDQNEDQIRHHLLILWTFKVLVSFWHKQWYRVNFYQVVWIEKTPVMVRK